MIKTSKVTDRRALRFGRMEDILRDAEWLNTEAEAGKTLRASGNWTPAQIVDHIAKTMTYSYDGFPPDAKVPLPIRFLAKMMKPSVLNKPMKPGMKLKGRMGELFAPEPNVTWGQAMTRLRTMIGRVSKGERMKAVSPAFGVMAHEEWMQLHCRHAEMHFGFIHAG